VADEGVGFKLRVYNACNFLNMEAKR
jgi:hypothetical protein